MNQAPKSAINVLDRLIEDVTKDKWLDTEVKENILYGIRLSRTKLTSEGFLRVSLDELPTKPIKVDFRNGSQINIKPELLRMGEQLSFNFSR